MYKFKIGLINIIGAALAGALMQLVWVFISNEDLTPYGVINMMVMSTLVGTICLFALFYVTLKNMGSLLKAMLTNMFLVVFLSLLIYLQTGIFHSYWDLDFKWVIILVIGESTALILTNFWYKKIKFYNSKLQLKKATLLKKEK